MLVGACDTGTFLSTEHLPLCHYLEYMAEKELNISIITSESF